MNFRLPDGFDMTHWAARWERMQERYLARREERFAVIADIIAATQASPRLIIDIGCGPGSLALRLLRAFEGATVVGVDFDPALLLLARERSKEFGPRARWIETDLREEAWLSQVNERCEVDAAKAPGGEVSGAADAIVSATALHWLSAEALEALYKRVARALRPGGVFLNADHAAASSQLVQALWDKQRYAAIDAVPLDEADDWRGFWRAFNDALKFDACALGKQMRGDMEGVEEGMPLQWHFEKLAAAGFHHQDCLWRLGGDAVYGAIRP